MKNAIDKRWYPPATDEQGMALVISMLLLVVLTVIGVAAVSTSNFEIMVAGSERRTQEAFYAAEAGLDHAKIEMKKPGYLLEYSDDEGSYANWVSEKILANAQNVLNKEMVDLGAVDKGHVLLKDVALNGNFTYTVSVFDNADNDNPAEDVDGVIYLWSQAVGKTGGKAGVVAEYYAGVIFTGDVQGQTSQLLDGSDKSGTSSDKNKMNTASNKFGLQATDLGQPNI